MLGRIRKGNLANVLSLAVLIVILTVAIAILLNALAQQNTILQRQTQKASQSAVVQAVLAKIGGCEAKVYDTFNGEWAVVIKADDIPSFCRYVQAVQIIGELNGVKYTYLIKREGNQWVVTTSGELGAPAVYPQICGTPNVTYSLDGSTKPTGTITAVMEVLPIDQNVRIDSVQILIQGSGWRNLGSCFLAQGGGVVQQTTIQQTVYSIGPITILAGSNFNPLSYICPPAKTVVGDNNAYVIATVLSPQINGTRNNVPTSYLIDLKSIIEKAAPPSSPLKVNEENVYIRNITVVVLRTMPGLDPASFSTIGYLPWSFTALNYTSSVPLYQSAGILTINMTFDSPMSPESLVQYSAVVCL
jgi:hypothetical protein